MTTGPSIKRERWALVNHITRFTDKLMIALAFIWVGLMIQEFTGALSQPLVMLGYIIWILFGIDFTVKFIIAPYKAKFLKKNWITLVSLILPAFRLLRIFQAARLIRTISFLRILTSTNRSMRAIARAMGRRGIGYIIAITVLILFAGAGGMYRFENPSELLDHGFNLATAESGMHNYSEALWWTAMLMTTIGTQYWPLTTGGRILCWLLSLYSLGVFGYITAAAASFFVGIDKEKKSIC